MEEACSKNKMKYSRQKTHDTPSLKRDQNSSWYFKNFWTLSFEKIFFTTLSIIEFVLEDISFHFTASNLVRLYEDQFLSQNYSTVPETILIEISVELSICLKTFQNIFFPGFSRENLICHSIQIFIILFSLNQTINGRNPLFCLP
jgi:hypothetical protein